MAPKNPCSMTSNSEIISTKPKRLRTQTLHRKRSSEKDHKEKQVIAFVPNPNGKKIFYPTDKEDSKNYEPIIAYCLTDNIGKKMFYITDKASLCRKCKPSREEVNEDEVVDMDISKNNEKNTEKGLSNAIFDLCQTTVVAASTREKDDESRNDTNIIQDKTDDSFQGEGEQQTTAENKKTLRENSNNENNTVGNDSYKSDTIEYDNSKLITKENNSKIKIITMEKESDITTENDPESGEHAGFFPGAQNVFKKVQEISDELFKTNQNYSEQKENPCEPQIINHFIESNNNSDIEDKEKEPATKTGPSRSILESVKSKIFAMFAKKSTVTENNVTYKVETNIVSSVHARNIEKSTSLYETMRKTVNSIFSLQNEDDEDAKTPPELQLGHQKSSRCFLRDIFFDDGFTSN